MDTAATGVSASGDAPLLVLLALAVTLLLAAAAVWSWRGQGHRNSNSAPSPPSRPLLGHLHLLGKPLHRSLAALASAHGAGGDHQLAPLLSLRLGARRTLVVSSHAAAEECFTSHDAALAGRPRVLAGDRLGYGYTMMVWASHGDHWRALRRLLAVDIFSASRVAARAAHRRAEVAALVGTLSHLHGGTVTLRSRLFELVLGVMLRALTGERAHGGDVRRFQEIVEETFAVSGAPSVGDFFPALRWVDRLRGVDAALVRLQGLRDAFVGGLVQEQRRRRDAAGNGRDTVDKKSIIDEFLSLQEADPEYYTDTIVKGLVLMLLTAGTDTSALTIEWAMALLLTHPEAMQKLRAEIESNVSTTRLVEESDITNLPYLQCVVKETLRLRPVGPIIPAHEAMEDCTIGGFHVERGTMILVNAWAIHRDPKLWDAVEEFRPERFLDAGMVTAVTTPMLPFGLGRRRCPGDGLALRMISLTLAVLVQCFDWDVDEGGGIDMTEGVGLTVPMAKPLAAVCRPREFVKSMLSAST